MRDDKTRYTRAYSADSSHFVDISLISHLTNVADGQYHRYSNTYPLDSQSLFMYYYIIHSVCNQGGLAERLAVDADG